MAKLASKVVEQAKAWVGLKESDGSYKVILDTYNSQEKLPRGHRMTTKDPWCAAFVSAVAVKLGYTDIIPTECSCNKMIELLKTIDSFVEDDSAIPSPGWILFYDWDDSGKGDNAGSSDHVGIVEKILADGKMTIIEGNYKNAVTRRTISVNGKYIRGWGVPKYDAEVKPAENKKGVCTVEVSVLKKGSKGSEVESMQTLLIGYGFSCGSSGADGDFGSNTDKAVRAYQKAKGLGVDGICGPKTWAKLLGTG